MHGSQSAHLLWGNYGEDALGGKGGMVDLFGILLSFYGATNRFHVWPGRMRLVGVVLWYLVPGPTNFNMQRVEDDRHMTI